MSSSIRSAGVYFLPKLDVKFVICPKMLTLPSPKLSLDQGDEGSFYSSVIGVFSSLAKALCCNRKEKCWRMGSHHPGPMILDIIEEPKVKFLKKSSAIEE